ncbi:MAG: hypothetical protein HQL77_02590 [Magnetococcales bacterium]|nr:hypothetical protein [Magnetococcales bacterium]
MTALSFILFAMIGVISVVLFFNGIYYPIWLSSLILFIETSLLVWQYRQNRLGVLMLLMWLVYALPFIHIPPYILFDFNSDPVLLWGLTVNPYMVDERVIQLTGMIGAVGGIGFVLGVTFRSRKVHRDLGQNPDGSRRVFRTMAMQLWLVWVVIGVILSALSAPQETILTTSYTGSKPVLENFGSAWMISYIILSFAYSDALLENNLSVKNKKKYIIFIAIIITIIFFNLMRGKRDSVPWVFGLALINYYWAAGITQRRDFTLPWMKLSIVAFLLVCLSLILGILRTELAGVSLSDAATLIESLYESERIGLADLLHGTWSAVLLTPLSVSGDHIYDLLKLGLGQDYLDLLLSTIPGFVADAIGYIRPIDGAHGPSWEMRYGLGGTHATVVPFMNFRMIGVLLIPAIWSFYLCNFEKSVLTKIDVIRLSFLVSLALAAPQWLWYGEKSGLNAVVIWIILSFFYRVSLGLTRSSRMNFNMMTTRECKNA